MLSLAGCYYKLWSKKEPCESLVLDGVVAAPAASSQNCIQGSKQNAFLRAARNLENISSLYRGLWRAYGYISPHFSFSTFSYVSLRAHTHLSHLSYPSLILLSLYTFSYIFLPKHTHFFSHLSPNFSYISPASSHSQNL